MMVKRGCAPRFLWRNAQGPALNNHNIYTRAAGRFRVETRLTMSPGVQFMTSLALRIALAAAALSFAPLAGAAEPVTPPAPPAAPVPLTIVVYDQPNFKGRTLTLAKPTPDLAALKFDDQVASLAIAGSGDWV